MIADNTFQIVYVNILKIRRSKIEKFARIIPGRNWILFCLVPNEHREFDNEWERRLTINPEAELEVNETSMVSLSSFVQITYFGPGNLYSMET